MSHDLPLANIITLGVSDVAGERDFYRRLGWPLVLDSADFVVFELRGALLALFGVDDLGRDAHAEPERGRGGIRSSIIITVDRSEDVDELTERARAAGARITKDPVTAEFFDGRMPTSLTRRATTGKWRGRPATTRLLPPPAAPPVSDRPSGGAAPGSRAVRQPLCRVVHAVRLQRAGVRAPTWVRGRMTLSR